MSDREGSDSDAPEEFTAEEGLQLDHELRKIQKENKERIKREGKERRKKLADRNTPRPSKAEEIIHDDEKEESWDEPTSNQGMLPKEIVNLLAARENRQVFSSDSEDEENADQKRQRKKKRAKKNGPVSIILNNLPPPQCLQTSLDFLNKRKMQVPRSNAVLDNSNKALRLLSSSGLLK